jgi:hypothetical protein
VGKIPKLKSIDPAEVDWDELCAVMTRKGWRLQQVVILHENRKIIAELGPNILIDKPAIESALDEIIGVVDEFEISKATIQ